MTQRLGAPGITTTAARRALGPSRRRRLACVAVVMTLAVLGGALASSPVGGQSGEDLEVRVVARRVDDGRTEFGFQERAPGGSWGPITAPTARFFPASTPVDRWLASSPVHLGIHVHVGSGTSEIRIVARRISDGRLEFGFQYRESGEAWSGIQLPRSRFFPTTPTVNRWLASSVLTVTIGPGSSDGSGGATTPPPPPPPPPPPEPESDVPASTAPYTAVSVGSSRVCGLHSDGRVTCWGSRWAREGLDEEFEAISVGGHGACGLRTGGTIGCWVGGSLPSEVRDARFIDVAVGDDHSCGIRTDGTILCWGDNSALELESPDGEFTDVAAGEDFSCAVRTDGTVDCWTFGSHTNPPDGEFESVSAGTVHACGVLTDGTVECWGNNASQQTGVIAGEYTAVSAGHTHTCAVRTDGEVACWGTPWHGQTRAPEGEFIDVSVDWRVSCGVRSDGTITCWGSNERGHLDVPE